MCGQTVETSQIEIAGMVLETHEFVPNPESPKSCIHCSLHPADLPHWTI